MKLVGGQSTYEGRVEVCLSQRWGTICDYGWSEADGLVVCKQLGYSSAGQFDELFFMEDSLFLDYRYCIKHRIRINASPRSAK